MSTLMGQLQAQIETAVNKTGTYNEALQNLADAFGVPPSETGSRLIPVVKVFDPTIDNATAAQNYLLYNSTVVAGGLPAMAMDFTSGTLDPRITFTRASTATRVNASGLIESVAINAPRFDYDPVSRAPKGLLIEEQRTNLLTYSEDFSNAAWAVNWGGGRSISTNVSTAPDGTLSVDSFTAISGASGVGQAVAVTAGVTYSFSVWIKTAGANLLARTVSDGGIGTDPKGIAVANTNGLLVRSTLTWTESVTGTRYVGVSCSPSGSAEIWGAQLEAGAFATSYIPTTSAEVTRSADNASMIGYNFANWYNASEGTVLIKSSSSAAASGYSGVVWFNDQTSNRGLSITKTLTAYNVYQRGTDNILKTITFNGYENNAEVSLATSYTSSALNAAANGSLATEVAVSQLYVPDRLTIGYQLAAGGAGYLNGHIKRIMYYNTRLTDAQLQALTS
jgi:hypothetical protein